MAEGESPALSLGPSRCSGPPRDIGDEQLSRLLKLLQLADVEPLVHGCVLSVEEDAWRGPV